MLELGDIDGYIIVESAPMLVVTGSGLNQTITKSFLDRYIQTESLVEEFLTRAHETAATGAGSNLTRAGTSPTTSLSAAAPISPESPVSAAAPVSPVSPAIDYADTSGIYAELAELLTPVSYTQEVSLTSSKQSGSVSYFFALLAMVCLYGGFQGMISVGELQANLSPLGARKTMSPAGRFRMVTYDLLGGLTMQFVCLTTVVAYISFVLGVSFGSQLWLLLLTCLVGSLLGFSFGAMISVTSKLKEQAKTAILIAVSMVLSFLSGLMIGGINYMVAQNVPIVAWLNPAARIADAFYCLYYYDTYERYFLNIGIILGMAVIMLAVTSVFLRRQRYESI